MDLGGKRFGTGPKELGGAIDLVNQFKLLHHHEFFCKRALPSSLSETHYLRNVVGDTEIRKGEGMELDQLFQTSSYVRQRDYSLCPFDLEVLGEAFRMRDLTPIDLPSVEKGIPTAVKPNSLSKDKEGQPRKHRVKYHGRNKHRHKYGISAENKKRGAHQYSVSEQLKNHLEKKRKHDGRGDLSVIHQNNGQHQSFKKLGC
ncbi:mediator of RNA polymerase II transcription subunit 19a isoform X2 [Citrus clementina]|uniref:mediator of RNA polymerase II transcription subunit 19a isoform X2 n=1 Tax=Citrus clementina TaxID=85681 RepID=UPI000CECFDE7|nr:mediator of RNA polymerase II transcription subunit 19a isoform X2 [Citrus x clementina]